MENTKTDVVVLGAGLAGLSCAHELTKKSSKKVTLVEKNPYSGGLAVTLKKDNHSFDSGPHRWFTKSEEVDQWLRDLLKEELVDVNRLTRIYYKGKYYFYPLKPLNALKNLGIIASTQAISSYLWVRMQLKLGLRSSKVNNIADAYINQFGKKLYFEFFHFYTEKLWGRKTTELSGDWASQRSKGLSIWSAVKDSIIKSKNVVSLIDKFKYPKTGFGRIAEKMEEDISSIEGNKFLFAQDVKTLNWVQNGSEMVIESIVVSHTSSSDIHDKNITISNKVINGNTAPISATTQTLRADNFVSSIPITELVFRMEPQAPENVIQAAKTLSFRDEIQVTLMINKAHFTPDNWVYTQDRKLIFVRLMEMDSWTDGLSPNGTTSIVFELACQEGDETWTKPDSELVDMVANNYINEFHYFEKENITGSYVHRVPKEYPVYDIGYKEKVDTIKEYISKFSNLQIIGRNGTFKYNNSDHSIQMGLYAARNIMGEKYDLENINTDRAYQEIKKVNQI
ncbi:MAG: FAD-dependent oxidoreductase [bacterium]|nr:FAD-dependent oxidoreductase [bacterium]